jgi:hypothetical protein
VLGHIEVDDAPALVSEHDEDEEDAEPSGGHGEEVEGDQISDMVGEECPPRLRRLGTPLRHQPGDGSLGHVDTELQELAMDSWGAPEGVRGGHAGDQSLDRGMDGRATSGRAARALAPVLAEAAPLPPQDGVGGDDYEGLPPPGPDFSQPDPEEAIRRAQLGSGRRSFVHRQLLPQGKVLDRELAVAAEEEREEPKHVEQEGDHRAEILSGSAPIDQRLAAGRGFGEGQAMRSHLGAFTQPWSFIGLPAMSVPIAEPGPLPLGVQLVARPFMEESLFRVAARLEQDGVVAAPVA